MKVAIVFEKRALVFSVTSFCDRDPTVTFTSLGRGPLGQHVHVHSQLTEVPFCRILLELNW